MNTTALGYRWDEVQALDGYVIEINRRGMVVGVHPEGKRSAPLWLGQGG